MGNICGKASHDPFAQPGRTLASTPAPTFNPTAPVPKKVAGPPRTLGPASASPGGNSRQEDARRKAAEAAETRANSASKPKGKLGVKLQEQKKQTRIGILEETSSDTRRMRDADEVAESRAYN
ncbi:hypothetical protein BJ875DRAFT_441589 [Amylocarpus encephaloides]|uniref:Uncharacterized protein n=1 Tax=Amylocarpus encephaloides TaxID=45428 RepID=A0A9P8C4Z0_9HELO|nr:hypothetical protein BJ875DRAFT_441589 [Amylocarpus encephaloides]